MQKSLIRKYMYSTNLFGVLMGVVFPIYASFFVNYKSSTHKVIFIVGAILAGIAVGGFSYYLTKKIILSVIKDITSKFEDLANNNDLSVLIKIDSDDEIGLLAECSNKFIEKIKIDMLNISDFVDKLSDTFKELEYSQNNIKKEVNISNNKIINIDSGIEEIRGDSYSSSEKLNNTVKVNVGEINNDLIVMSDNLRKADNNSSVIETMSFSISEEMQKIDEDIVYLSNNSLDAARISENAKEDSELTTKKIEELSVYTKNIENIINLIQSIASKTNLLALNATIEAARAGDVGKGFAVVANEIKNLANQTNKAVAEIQKQINDIENSMIEGLQRIENLNDVIINLNDINNGIANKLDNQKTSISNVSVNTDKNLKLIKENNMHISQILNTLETSTGNIGNIDKDIKKISNETRNTSNKINSISQDMKTIKDITNKINNDSSIVDKNAKTLFDISQKLSVLVKKFKL